MNCRLCEKNEVINSHIIPEFFYKPIYDKKNRFFKISTDPSKKNLILQKGLREKLLCKECETELSKYEKYVSELIYKGKDAKVSVKGKEIYLRNLDYKKIRLCFLSILWRLSISSQDTFKGVALGLHENKIKDLILRRDPGKTDQYGLLCIAPLIDGKFCSDLIMQPARIRLDSHITYWLVMGGLIYIFYVSTHSIPKAIRKGFIQEDGSWVITVGDGRKIKFIDHVFTKACKAQKIRNSSPLL